MSEYYIKNGEDYEKVNAFSQDDLDSLIDKRLGRERAKYADYNELKEKVEGFDAVKSDYESKLADAYKERDELASQLKQANLNTEKANILREFNIKDDLAEFITGADANEMRERAEKLSRSTVGSAVTLDKVPKQAPKRSDIENIREGLFGNKANE
jgi:hypothetical protein